MAALAILGATVVALTYTCRTTGGGPRHARVRVEPDDAREVELQGPIVRRSTHLVDGEPPLAIAEALPLAEAVSVTARLVDTSDIESTVWPRRKLHVLLVKHFVIRSHLMCIFHCGTSETMQNPT